MPPSLREQWKEGFDYIVFSIIGPFAERYSLSLATYLWDAVDAELRWTHGEIDRSLHIFVDRSKKEEYVLVVEGSAWIDSEEPGRVQRHWHSERLWERTFRTTPPGNFVEWAVRVFTEQVLEDAYDRVHSWAGTLLFNRQSEQI